MLEVRDLETYYGDARALESVSVTIGEGEIVAIVGSNGAGKTTLVKSIAGIMPVRSGSVRLDGAELTRLSRHRVVATGLAIVPEGRRLFAHMTVRENLEVGAYAPGVRADFDSSLEQAHELFPFLADRADQMAGTLSGGEQQMLSIARALMAQPRYLLMDEPSLGLAPMILDTMFDLILRIHETGVAVLIIEQNVARALEICQRGYVMEEGRVVLSGQRDQLLGSERIRKAYLAL